jgi:osmotically-inducible protein OsmY
MRVFGALRDATEYKLGSVEVKPYRGVVQLSGFVNTPEQKRMAGEIAGRVEGVRQVENNITIKPEGGQTR